MYWKNLDPNRRFWLSAALAGVIVSLVVIRSWKIFLWPGFFIEDSPLWFNYYYGGKRAVTDVFRIQQGYIRFSNESLAWLFAHVDIRLQPYLYAFSALLLSVTVCMTTTALNFFKSVCFTLGAPLILALVAVDHVLYFSSLSAMAWMQAIWLFLLLLKDPPQKPLPFTVYILIILLLTWSHPYALLGAPVAWLLWAFFPSKKGMVTASLVTLSLTGVLFLLNPGQFHIAG